MTWLLIITGLYASRGKYAILIGTGSRL